MKIQTIFMTTVLCLFSLAAFAGQDITISPGDDVYEVLQTVTEPDSTVTFEPGLYKIFPPAGTTGTRDLFEPPPRTTIRGAGFGFNPDEDTILDCQSLFRHGFDLGGDSDGVTVANLTITNVFGNLIYIGGGADDATFENVWAVRSLLRCVENDGGAANFSFCVFGLAADDVIFNDDNNDRMTFTNCDIFLVENDLIEAQAGEAVFRNCIFYAGNGNNFLENNGGTVIVRSSVGWDPYSGDLPGITQDRFGRLRLDDKGGVFPDVDNSNVGEDPLYVLPPGQIAPGVGVVVEEMDLRLQEGSPALFAGSTSFDANGDPNGSPTFAGSQGDLAYIVVDDFESYNNIDPPDANSNRIFESWIDGFGVAANGALVGYDPPQPSYAETAIVHGGGQSMPIAYDNSSATVSEVTRTFDPAQDWSISGITTLSLFVKNVAGQGTGGVYVKINDTQIDLVNAGDYPPGATPGWVGYNVDLAGMDVASVQSLTIGIAGAGAEGVLYVDDIRLYKTTSDVPADSDLVARWTFDEGSGATATDSSGNGLDGAVVGAVWASPGSNGLGSCLDFDGLGENMVDLGNFDVTTGTGLTIACWYKAENLDTPGSDPRLFSKAIGGSREDHWFMVSSSRTGADKVLRFRLKTDDSTGELKADAATGLIDLDVWTHVAAVWDGVAMKLYKNGVEVASVDKGGVLSTNPAANVAIGNQPAGTPGRPWDGLIDDVQLYNRGLSGAEILALMGQ